MAARNRLSKLVALDWDTRTLRIVHAHLGKRGVKIERLLSVTIPDSVESGSPASMGAFIRQALDQEGIRTRHATVDIPRDQAILNTLKLPIAARDALPGMVRIQVAKELPFPVTAAAIDFSVPPGEATASTADVLVAAVRNEVVEQYAATAEAAGLKLERVGLRSWANRVAVCEFLRHALPERVLLVDVRPTFTEIGILHNGALVFSRAASVSIPPGLDDESNLSLSALREAMQQRDEGEASASVAPRTGESVVGTVVDEVMRSVEAYRSRDAAARIDHAVISGDLGIEERLAEVLQRRFSITADLYNPASTFGWEPDEGAEAAAFAASLGLVLSHAADGQDHFDFLHPKRTETAATRRMRRAPALAAVLILFLAAPVIFLMEATKHDRRQLAEINKQIEDLKSKERDYQKFVALVEEVRSFDQDQLVWVDVLVDLLGVLPSNEELVIERIDLKQKDQRIDLVTRAKRRAVATEVVRRLEDFRREGRDQPRFSATFGSQVEKPGEKYPFSQKFTIEVRNDAVKSGGKGKRPAQPVPGESEGEQPADS